METKAEYTITQDAYEAGKRAGATPGASALACPDGPEGVDWASGFIDGIIEAMWAQAGVAARMEEWTR